MGAVGRGRPPASTGDIPRRRGRDDGAVDDGPAVAARRLARGEARAPARGARVPTGNLLVPHRFVFGLLQRAAPRDAAGGGRRRHRRGGERGEAAVVRRARLAVLGVRADVPHGGARHLRRHHRVPPGVLREHRLRQVLRGENRGGRCVPRLEKRKRLRGVVLKARGARRAGVRRGRTRARASDGPNSARRPGNKPAGGRAVRVSQDGASRAKARVPRR